HVVDDVSPGTRQLRQEGLRHGVGPEEVDGKVALEYVPVAQVVVERDAGVVDQDVEGVDALGGRLDLRRAGYVQGNRRDPRVRVGGGPARACVHALCAPAEGFGDQRLPDAAIGPGDQDRLACYSHRCCSVWLWVPRRSFGGYKYRPGASRQIAAGGATACRGLRSAEQVPGSGAAGPRRGRGRTRRPGRGAVLRWQAEGGEQARVREGDD